MTFSQSLNQSNHNSGTFDFVPRALSEQLSRYKANGAKTVGVLNPIAERKETNRKNTTTKLENNHTSNSNNNSNGTNTNTVIITPADLLTNRRTSI